MTRRQRLALAAALSLISAIPLSYRLFHPFVTAADSNTASFAQPARNVVRHGPLATGFGLAVDAGDARPQRFLYNDRHPPLAALGAAAVFLVTGIHDWAARIYPALCSLASSLLLFCIWRRHRGDLAAALAALIMATLPAYGHFGKMLGEESPTLMFALLTLLLYQKWKQAPSRGHLAGALAAYAAGCLSGWAAFHMGPILMAEAAITLRGRARWRVPVAIALTGLITFAVILGHLVLLSGSLDALFGAAVSRTVASASGVPFARGPDSWIRQETGHFQRLFGQEAAILGLAGVLSGIVAIIRRRARKEALFTILILTAFALAHPLLFRWAAYIHDWLLFHMLPILGIAAAEGILLLAALASGLARLAGAPSKPAMAAVAIVAAVPLGHRALLCTRDLRFLATEEPRFAWPLLGRAIAEEAPRRTFIMTNFDLVSLPLRFYADRPFRRARTIEQYDLMRPAHPFSLYVRDMNVPIDPGLASLLEGHPCRKVASYRLCDLRDDRGVARGGGKSSEGEASTVTWGGPTEAAFSNALRLTGYEVTAPARKPEASNPLASFLGVDGGALAHGRIVRVRSFWRSMRPDLPRWRMFAGVTRQQADGTWLGLPILALLETKRPLISRWSGHEQFNLESVFLFPHGYPCEEYEVRFALYDGGRPITPVVPGPPVEGLKAVVAGKIRLFAGSEHPGGAP